MFWVKYVFKYKQKILSTKGEVYMRSLEDFIKQVVSSLLKKCKVYGFCLTHL